jgi:hypothetical protein
MFYMYDDDASVRRRRRRWMTATLDARRRERAVSRRLVGEKERRKI